MISPAQFIQQVRQEMGKVTWPTRKETVISTVLVLVLAGIASVFFLAVDGAASFVISSILGIRG